MSFTHDLLILGAGGAGMRCALTAAQRGRRVLMIDKAEKPGGKIVISGGGRCNFTNREVTAKNFVSQNPHFAKSALSRYTPADFIALVERHGIAYHERKHGQLFCDVSAKLLVGMLTEECRRAGAMFLLGQTVEAVGSVEGGFFVRTAQEELSAPKLVVATGGLSIPKFGATGLGYDIATQFGLRLVTRAPALDGFVFQPADLERMGGFEGNAIDATMRTNGVLFRENLLFTHTGLSGPVALQASLHWRPGEPVVVNFLPALSREVLLAWFAERRGVKGALKNQLAALLPARLAERMCALHLPPDFDLANASRARLEAFCDQLQGWQFVPQRTVGYHKAEVTRGGVDTDELSSKTMEARRVPGLYFIGEVVDVTGWLGGFNYQWAWSSGWAAGMAV